MTTRVRYKYGYAPKPELLPKLSDRAKVAAAVVGGGHQGASGELEELRARIDNLEGLITELITVLPERRLRELLEARDFEVFEAER